MGLFSSVGYLASVILYHLIDCSGELTYFSYIYSRTLMQTLLLVWQHARRWATPVRLANLVRCICDDIISGADKWLPGAPSHLIDKI